MAKKGRDTILLSSTVILFFRPLYNHDIMFFFFRFLHLHMYITSEIATR